jgi:hypothetical protein
LDAQRSVARQFSFEQIVGESPAAGEMLLLARKVAESEASSVPPQAASHPTSHTRRSGAEERRERRLTESLIINYLI